MFLLTEKFKDNIPVPAIKELHERVPTDLVVKREMYVFIIILHLYHLVCLILVCMVKNVDVLLKLEEKILEYVLMLCLIKMLRMQLLRKF